MTSKFAFVLSLALAALLVGAAAASAADLELTTTVGGVQPGAGARTVPFFSDSFTFNGTAYPYTMVGTNPRASRVTTTVGTVIVPLRLVFADGQVAEPGSAVSSVVASPLFQPESTA
jgi:uncharacterized protein (DUF2141 family)